MLFIGAAQSNSQNFASFGLRRRPTRQPHLSGFGIDAQLPGLGQKQVDHLADILQLADFCRV
jgi:hypothetical protein